MKKITLLFILLAFSFSFAQENCASVIDLGALTSPYSGDTTGAANDFDQDCLTNAGAPDQVFSIVVPNGSTISIGQTVNAYDSKHRVAYGGACPGATLITCVDDPDTGNVVWINDTGSDQTVYWVQSAYSTGSGTFELAWQIFNCAPPSATVAVVEDCANNQFSVDVDITDLGSNGTLSITNSVNGDVVNVDSGVGIYTAGPFPAGGGLTISIEGDNADCNVTSGTLTDSCPPTNDECDNAIPVVCDGNYLGSTSAATDSGGNLANDVWFSYTGSGVAEDVTLEFCDSGYDTLVRVYSDCPATNQIAQNDDACGTRSTLTFSSDGTSTYYIMVEGYSSNSGTFDMNVTCAANVPAPANDLCVNAEALTLDVQAAGTTAGATDDSTGNVDDTTCDSFTFKSDVWYSFVAPADGDVGIMTAITGTSDQANVAVYPDCNQLDADSLGCSDGNGGEMLDVTGLTAGNTYYVRVWSDGVAARQGNFRTEGTFTITVSDATLSTEDFTVSSDLFTYYPNPVNSNLTLNAQRDITNVVVYNMLGQQVMRSTPNTVNSEVNMTTLNPGAYFVQVTVDNKTETIRIIKN
ncbi:T9SS type A sorting domain-containing protein [Hanstruepera marina]|uniref:T9SS type A sorting domain-containing protein n=1 Tax=Hanstruepera marina TaxID=2873265 RepID=UPI001CA6C482|nr:T9SS type A sorting domain-containing protein [Hanstruepera marina]